MRNLLKTGSLLFLIAGTAIPAMGAAPTAVMTATTGIKKDLATFNGTVTSKGLITAAQFEYVKGSFDPLSFPIQTQPIPAKDFAATDENKTFSLAVTGLEHDQSYQVRIKATNGDGTFTTAPVTVQINAAPTPKDDDLLLQTGNETTVEVLKNDSDPDGLLPEPDGDELTITSVTAAKDGSVRISGDRKTLIYKPAQNPKGFDSIVYTVSDGSKTATATLTIRSPRLALHGMQAFQLKNADGASAGQIRLVATGNGSFSGKVTIGSQTYVVHGTLDANGKFKASLPSENGPIEVSFAIKQDATDGSSFTANVVQNGTVFESDSSLADLKFSRRQEMAGKYTIQLPPPGSDDSGSSELPQGTGFARLEVKEWGDVRIAGKLGDGSKFSTRGVIMGEGDNAVMTFYAAPKNGRVTGELAFGAGADPALTGTLQWFRPERGDAHFFPDGFFVDVTTSGGRYIPPDKGDRALDASATSAERMKITLSGGNLRGSITHNIELGSDDGVTILDLNRNDLQLKINRKKGLFSGQFTHNDDDENRKFQGALLQSSQSGRGVFIGQSQTGNVELSIESSSTPPPAEVLPVSSRR